jgi:uncharacterized damage-inducible protein DinB
MAHPLVTQLRFARSEFVRCLEGVSAGDAVRRLMPMNSLSWMVGHLAAQEHRYWVELAQGRDVTSDLYGQVGYGKPDTGPSWEEMWEAWRAVTVAADLYLDTVDAAALLTHPQRGGRAREEDIGTSLLRNIYHYWYHLGEAHAVRAMLGHSDLPEFVGSMSTVRHSADQQS